jgi:hypothetical protein
MSGMAKLWAEFQLAFIGGAFYLIALAAQVSGHISAPHGFWLYLGGAALLALGLWPYDPYFAVGAAFAAMLVPAWLGRRQLLARLATMPWALQAPLVRKKPKTEATQSPSHLEERAPLTSEQIQFRMGLRNAVVQLSRADTKLREVVTRLLAMHAHPNTDGSAELAHYASIVVAARTPKIDLLSALTTVPIDEIDTYATQANIVKYLDNTYLPMQHDIHRVNAKLKAKLDAVTSFSEWIAEDTACVSQLRSLKASPEATTLRHANEEALGSVGRQWQTGPAATGANEEWVSRNSWPDFDKWDTKNVFRLFEAAALWNDEEPKLPMSATAQRTFKQFHRAIYEKKLRTKLSLDESLGVAAHEIGDYPKPDEDPITVNTTIGRKHLRAYADEMGQKPKFLFTDQRAKR